MDKILKDHPRVCGEHHVEGMEGRVKWGSSPRMRGARWGYLDRRHSHPRVCGEHDASVDVTAAWLGSSPRMRGAPCHIRSRCGQTGIIPAYAGSTVQGYAFYIKRTDHPRVCGEHRLSEIGEHGYGGSSPRMRGAHRGAHPYRIRQQTTARIIPAYAGSTPRLDLRKHYT